MTDESQPQHSIRKLIINPNDINSELLDEMYIDTGIRGLVAELLRHGYNTAFSCEGHGRTKPYISFERGTGDGTFKSKACQYGLQLREPKDCCKANAEPFCPKCGSSEKYVTYERSQPFNLEI